jgi:2-phospho-L-lactate guanylyltransferase
MSTSPLPPQPGRDRPVPAPWHVVVPVKDTRLGKSRLAPAAGADRARLSRAIADDTLAAAAAAVGPARIVLVTSDRTVASSWRASGVVVTDDPGTGLNGALLAGLACVPDRSGAAALLGDLPALTSADLRAALDLAAAHPQAYVPDVDGTGTVLRTSAGGVPRFVPRFGPDSARLHHADGARRLDVDLPGLRTDVDDAVSLAAACRLGVGAATREVVEARASGWMRSMQASVHTFDPYSRTGSVLRDDGRQVPFDADVFDRSGLRLLRVGQRLTVQVVDDHVVSLGIVGIGDDQVIR